MTLFDHLLFIVIVVAYPIYGYVSFRKLMKRVAAGETIDRAELYNHTMIGHWTIFAVMMAIWLGTARPWPDLGLHADIGTGFLLGLVLTVAAIAFLVVQRRSVRNALPDDLDRFREQIGELGVLMPRNANELGRWYAVSLTAGIVEEVVWRGFLVWYSVQFMPLWAAAILNAIVFGLGHSYQGLANSPKVTLAGAALVGLFLLTGSLWLPIILHAAADAIQGRTVYDVLRRSAGGGSVGEGAAQDARSSRKGVMTMMPPKIR